MFDFKSWISGVRGASGETAFAASERALPRQEEAALRLLAEHSNDVICLIDPGMSPLYVSPSVRHVLGWTPEEMIAAGPAGLVDPRDADMLEEVHDQLMQGDEVVATITLRTLRKDGSAIWMEVSGRKVDCAVSGGSCNIAVVMRDVSERKRLEEQLLAQSLTDALTGLSNRRAFDAVLERECQRTVREGAPISLLLLDIDHFKEYNDRYGHMAGDACLCTVAEAVKRTTQRPGDFTARYGGEELVVIMPGTDAQSAAIMAERVRAAVEQLAIPHSGNGGVAPVVTVSVGAATAPAFARGGFEMPANLVMTADRALYSAKNNGRNRTASAFLTDMDDGV